MRLLLDTCTFLWLAADDARLTPRARSACRSPDNAVFLSALCAWEISIKHRLGRLPLPEPPVRYVVSHHGHSVTRKTMKTAHGTRHGGRHFRSVCRIAADSWR